MANHQQLDALKHGIAGDYALAHKISRVYARSPVMRRDREDLVQEAVMGLIGKPDAPRSTTMTRRIIDLIRRETHRGKCSLPDQLRGDAFAATSQYLAIEERLDLLRVLRKMVAALEAGLDASVVEELDASDGRKRRS